MILILSAAIVAIPSIPSSHALPAGPSTNDQSASTRDPNGALTAFNYTYSQANLYTNSSSPPPKVVGPTSTTGVDFLWQSTVNRTKDNSRIQGTGFQFNLTNANLPTDKQTVSWNLTIPQFNCNSCSGVSVNFNFFGKITSGTNASYVLSNGTNIISTQAFKIPGTFPASSTVGCPDKFDQHNSHNHALSTQLQQYTEDCPPPGSNEPNTPLVAHRDHKHLLSRWLQYHASKLQLHENLPGLSASPIRNGEARKIFVEL